MEISPWVPIAIAFGALVISCISLGWNIAIELGKKKAKLQVWQRNTFYAGGEDERTKINLVIRNMSHRPTAVIDIYVRNADGGIIKGVGERDDVELPARIDPWDVKIVSFRINKPDENRMKDILVKDIDDNEIIVERRQGQTWHG